MSDQPTRLADMLRSGRSSEALGMEESTTLEFKAEPFRFQTSKQRQEFAKDLSALANAAGGVLALGFKTEKEVGRATDSVRNLRPFPRAMFDEEQWRKVLAEWVFPRIEDVTFEWFPEQHEKGFLTITVPRQRASSKPFVVTRSVAEDDRVDGVLFGIFERRHTDASPFSVAEVHSMLRDGRLFRAAIDERSGDSQGSSPLPAAPGDPGIPSLAIEKTLQRAARLIEVMHLAEFPTYVLTATPYPELPARQMFAKADHPVVQLLHRPPEIRSSGFDMDTGKYPDIVSGESRRSFVDGYKGKELWQDGTLVFVATGGPDFLSWGNRDPELPLMINQVTLVESAFLFVRLYEDIWRALGSPSTRVEFAIHLARMCSADKPPILRPGRLGSHSFRANSAPACAFHQRETTTAPFDAATVAYSLVARVYEWFGYEHDRIPYAAANQVVSEEIAGI